MSEHALVAVALQELRDLVDSLDTLGADFTRRYVEWLVLPDMPRPKRPAGLHVDLANAIRDVIQDVALGQGVRLPVAAR